MPSPLSVVDQIHSRALEISSRYKRAEAELVDVLQQIDEFCVFLKRGHSSLFAYVTSELGLSESAAYGLITIARKAREVPQLKAELETGTLTLSNARRIVPILTPANQGEWIQKAKALSNRQLEKEIVKIHPKTATPERTTYITPDRIKLELGLSEAEMLRLRQAQDLLSQSKRRAVSLEETVEAMTSEFLNRHDPTRKAERHQVKKTAHLPRPDQQTRSKPVGKLCTLRVPKGRREPIPAALLHQANLRDQKKCAHTRPGGSRCNRTRWLEVHHRIPVSQGGANTIENLITLCSTHHRFLHAQGEE